MASVDKITFEVIRHKLWRIVEEQVSTLKRVSGTLTTVEGNDLMCGLYTGDGELVKGGIGFLYHLIPASVAVKYIIKNFGEDPGIFEDDIFLLNDPYIAAMHQPDMYAISPIHRDGEIIAWSANFVHILDIGSVNPGGFCPESHEVFQEGLSLPGVKVVERGVRRKDVFEMITNMSREPTMVALDLCSQIAACNVAKARVLELAAKFGTDTLTSSMNMIIKSSEDRFRGRLRELPDGNWSSIQFLDTDEKIYEIVLSMRKKSDLLEFDFEGSSVQSDRGINCTFWGTMGGVFASVLPLLCYDIPWNGGLANSVTVRAPEGTIINARRPAPVSIATVATLPAVALASQVAISKMLAASERYRDEASAAWYDVYGVLKPFGINRSGNFFVGGLLDRLAGSGGATAWRDGIDTGGILSNSAAASPNVETTESRFPILYLFKRHRPNSGGPGKFRGGLSGEVAFTVHDAPERKLGFIIFTRGVHVAECAGLNGGYPGASNQFVLLNGTDMWKLFKKGKIPQFPGDLKGTVGKVPSLGIIELAVNDVFFKSWGAGGGYGDPIDREPRLVQQDVREGAVSSESARKIYGVILDPENLTVNKERTEKLRSKIRRERLRAVSLRSKHRRVTL